MRLPSLSLNKDWMILGGTAILAITGLVYLHNRFAGYVPTVPGVRYGPGGPATGIYTTPGGKPVPFPVAQDIYGTARPYIDPVTGEVQSLGRQGIGAVQSMMGYTSGAIGRGAFRDQWTDVYDPKKGPTWHITHDDPEKRVSLA